MHLEVCEHHLIFNRDASLDTGYPLIVPPVIQELEMGLLDLSQELHDDFHGAK